MFLKRGSSAELVGAIVGSRFFQENPDRMFQDGLGKLADC